jgi:uncharacterized protein (TIGR02466 family)
LKRGAFLVQRRVEIGTISMSDEARPKASGGVLASFTTPIFSLKMTGIDALNASVCRAITDRQAIDAGVQRSNRGGGWSSDGDAHRWPGTGIPALLQIITDIARQTLEKHYPGTAPIALEIDNCWANVGAQDAWRAPHYHPGATWSGCYYLSVGDAESHLGGISFINPVLAADLMWQRQQVELKPQNGDLLIFPGNMMHYVPPNPHEQDRITLAFNFIAKPANRPWISPKSGMKL